jgi:prevent-host-death family protein
MRSIGAYDAKTHLPGLLDDVAKGEIITITKHGVAVAMLVPPPRHPTMSVGEAIAELEKARKGVTLGDALTIRELIEEGRG